MTMKLLAAVAAMSLAACSAYTSSANGPTAAQSAGPRSSVEYSQSSQSVGGSEFHPTVPAYAGETPHVIGGQKFYFNAAGGGGGGDGAG